MSAYWPTLRELLSMRRSDHACSLDAALEILMRSSAFAHALAVVYGVPLTRASASKPTALFRIVGSPSTASKTLRYFSFCFAVYDLRALDPQRLSARSTSPCASRSASRLRASDLR